MLIFIGTSLQVQPFASLVKKVLPNIPRLLINMEEVGTTDIMDTIMPSISRGFTFNHANNFRDVKLLGECQAGVKKLADLLGWGQELEELYEREKKVVLATAPNKATPASPAKAEPFRNADAATTTTTTSESAPANLTQPSSEPAQSTSEPAVEAAKPAPEPAQSTPEPKPAPPVQSTPEPAKEPTQSTAEPAKPAQSTPTKTAQVPEKATAEQPTTQPAQSTPQPAQPTTQPEEKHSS